MLTLNVDHLAEWWRPQTEALVRLQCKRADILTF